VAELVAHVDVEAVVDEDDLGLAVGKAADEDVSRVWWLELVMMLRRNMLMRGTHADRNEQHPI